MSVKLKSSVPVYTIVQLLNSFAHDSSIVIIHKHNHSILKKILVNKKSTEE